MSCGSKNRNCYQKSCVRVYNNSTQPVVAIPSQMTLEGSSVVESGCSCTLNTANIQVNNSGLYHLSADVVVEASTAGPVTAQLYQGTTPLPCAIATTTAEAGSTYSLHVETDLKLCVCCNSHPSISLYVGGTSGIVTHLCVGCLKLA